MQVVQLVAVPRVQQADDGDRSVGEEHVGGSGIRQDTGTGPRGSLAGGHLAPSVPGVDDEDGTDRVAQHGARDGPQV